MTTAAGTTDTPWFAQEGDAVVASVATDRDAGLTSAEAERRLAEHGPNAIAAEPEPSVWQVSLRQLADPMNVMLVAVVILNVFLGTRQEMKAKASVDALAKMQIPKAKVIRDGVLLQVDATSLVPGDVITLEAGDIVPADGRIIRSATLETQEAALTGESAPIAKDAAVIA